MSRERATMLVVLRVLKDAIAATDERVRADLAADLMVGERVKAAVDTPDGPAAVGDVAYTKRAGSKAVVLVKDREALLRWVLEHAPDETSPAIRPSFEKRLLDVVLEHGGWPDPATGELLDVDGLEVKPAAAGAGGTITVKPNEDAVALIQQAWATGSLNLADVLTIGVPPALEPGA